jgi:hypothetical protein
VDTKATNDLTSFFKPETDIIGSILTEKKEKKDGRLERRSYK